MDQPANIPPAGSRILVVNPNSNPDVTDLVRKAAGRVLGPGWTADAIHPAAAPHSIETLGDRTKAEPLVVDLLSRRRGYDAYVMACFDDIAVKAGRSFLLAPVVYPVEASIFLARLVADRFCIVTTVEGMVPGIRSQLAHFGAQAQCTVRAAGIGVASAATAGGDVLARLDQTVENAINHDGAKAIILGSGGLTGKAADLSARHGLPVIDSIEAAVVLAEASARGFMMTGRTGGPGAQQPGHNPERISPAMPRPKPTG